MIMIARHDLRVGARRIVSRVGSLVRQTTEPRILMYHRIFDSKHRLAVAPDLFIQHLDLFQEMRLEVLSVKELLSRRGEPGLSAIALSFDDGYPEMAEFVAPALKARGMNATFFVLPRFAEKPQELSPEAEWADGGRDFLSRDQIIHLDREGFEIAAHGLTHHCMPDLPDKEARHEIIQSRRELESLLGHPISGFAYPKGSYFPHHSLMADQAGYDYAVTVDPGHLSSGPLEHLLPRTEVAGGDDPELLRDKLAGGLDLWHQYIQKTRRITNFISRRA